MTESDYVNINSIEEVNEDFTIVTKNRQDIIEELSFNNEEEKLLCESIIDNLEEDIFNAVRDNLTVSIPFIGRLRKDPVKEMITKNKNNFKLARQYLSKEEYKEHVTSFIVDARQKQLKKDKFKTLLHKIKQNNKKKYELYYKTFGRSYAELFLYSIYWLDELPFDIDIQAAYDKLKED